MRSESQKRVKYVLLKAIEPRYDQTTVVYDLKPRDSVLSRRSMVSFVYCSTIDFTLILSMWCLHLSTSPPASFANAFKQENLIFGLKFHQTSLMLRTFRMDYDSLSIGSPTSLQWVTTRLSKHWPPVSFCLLLLSFRSTRFVALSLLSILFVPTGVTLAPPKINPFVPFVR